MVTAERLTDARLPYFGLRAANFTTLAHFSVSSAISLPKSAGEPASTVPPVSASRARMAESAKAALIALLSASTISAGVPLGAPMRVAALTSKPGTKSPSVGRSGSACERVVPVTARTRSLLPLPSLPRSRVRKGGERGGQRLEHQVRSALDRALERGGFAGIADEGQVDARHHPEQLAGCVRRTARIGQRQPDLAWIGLGIADQLRRGRGRNRGDSRGRALS